MVGGHLETTKDRLEEARASITEGQGKTTAGLTSGLPNETFDTWPSWGPLVVGASELLY